MKKTVVTARNQRVSSRKQRKQQHLLDVKVRSRAAKRQRYRWALAWVSAFLLIAGSLGGAVYGCREALRHFFWQNPEYRLSEIEVHTDGSLSRDQILQASNIREGVNIFTVSLSAARKSLMALPQVERAEIGRVLPNKVTIEVAERKPVAWVTGTDAAAPGADPGAYLIDSQGTLMSVKNEVSAYFHLPVICGLAVENYEDGQTVDLPEVASALELIRLTNENPDRYQVRSIDVSKGYCLVVSDDRHRTVTLPLDNIAAKLDLLTVLFANVDASKREIQTVNLLVDRNIPVTFFPQSQPDAGNAADAAVAPDGPDGVAPADASPSPAAPAVSPKPAASPRKSEPTVKRAHLAHLHHTSTTVRRAIPISTPGSGFLNSVHGT